MTLNTHTQTHGQGVATPECLFMAWQRTKGKHFPRRCRHLNAKLSVIFILFTTSQQQQRQLDFNTWQIWFFLSSLHTPYPRLPPPPSAHSHASRCVSCSTFLSLSLFVVASNVAVIRVCFACCCNCLCNVMHMCVCVRETGKVKRKR